MGRPVRDVYASRKYCRRSIDGMATPRRGVPIDGDIGSVWRPATSEVEKGENVHHVRGRAGEETETPCTYGGRALLDDSAGDSEDNRLSGTRSVLPGGGCVCLLHNGASGTPCKRGHRSDILCRVLERVSGGEREGIGSCCRPLPCAVRRVRDPTTR